MKNTSPRPSRKALRRTKLELLDGQKYMAVALCDVTGWPIARTNRPRRNTWHYLLFPYPGQNRVTSCEKFEDVPAAALDHVAALEFGWILANTN